MFSVIMVNVYKLLVLNTKIQNERTNGTRSVAQASAAGKSIKQLRAGCRPENDRRIFLFFTQMLLQYSAASVSQLGRLSKETFSTASTTTVQPEDLLFYFCPLSLFPIVPV